MFPERPKPSAASRFFVVVVRTLFVTLLFTLLGMGIGLFAGIIAVLALAIIRNIHPDMQLAYMRVAIPAAIAFGVIAFLYTVVQEIRRAAQRS
jgi:uncharacterized BrkB/YihY/UPF0761 family membrane protein